MTAEIIVMNKNAIALAADSAVTFQVPSEEGLKQKIYNTTNKLFTLSKYHPVGIMIFGNSEILNVPWEVVIKTFRQQLGMKVHKTVEEYAIDFISYVGKFFTDRDQENHFFQDLVSFFHGLILQNINEEVKNI
jgi:hypothetical protein